MKRILSALLLAIPLAASANPLHCTIEEAATVMFKTHPTSKDPKMETLSENDYMISMIDMNTVKNSNGSKTVWIWNFHKVGDPDDRISKLKVVFDGKDPEVFKPVAAVSILCNGKTADNQVNPNADWMIMSVGSPAYFARAKLYGKKF